jgi:hypothetical protein
MIRKIAIILCVVNLTGCQSMLQTVGNFYDYRDQCQSYGKSATWSMPDYCGAGLYSKHGVRIYDNAGRPVGYTR